MFPNPKYSSPLLKHFYTPGICPKRDGILCTLSGKPRVLLDIYLPSYGVYLPWYATRPQVVMDPTKSVNLNRQALDHKDVSRVQFEQLGSGSGMFVCST